MYDELVKRLREAAISADSGNEISESLYRDIMQAADAIEELQKHVPKRPHGRLVDADKLSFDMMDAANADQALAMVDDPPTVIEAEEGE